MANIAAVAVAVVLAVVVATALMGEVVDYRRAQARRREWDRQAREWSDMDAAGSCWRRNERG